MKRALALLVTAGISGAFAQAPPVSPGRIGIGGAQPPPPLPAVEPERESPPRITLPPGAAPPPTGEDSLAAQLRVTVRRFEIDGATVFPQDELRAIVAPYEGRSITSLELRELQDRLTLHYVERGYINSGALIPDQRIVDGVVRIRIVEGRLARVEVSGTANLRPDYVSSRVMLGGGPPLSVDAVQSELLLLQQKPTIERVTAELVPGDEPGEAVLKVKVDESPQVFATLGVANDQPPSTGAVRASVSLGWRSVTGRGDALAFALGATQGSGDVAVNYSIPLTARDTMLAVSYDRTSARVIEEPFAPLDIESTTETYGISLSSPLVRTPTRQIALGATLQLRENRTSLLGSRFSFVEGSPDGATNVTALRLFQEWIETRQDLAVAARSTFSLGLEAMGASRDTVPDSRFVAWLGQFQWVQRLNDQGLQAVVRGDAQLSSDRLLPMEQIAVGGMRTVRGYRENQLVRDSALVVSAELRVPVFGGAPGPGNLQLALFADYGITRNSGGSTPPPNDIGSIGVGLRWAPHPKISGELYWGYRLRDVPKPADKDLQDHGVHFAVIAQVF